MQKKTDKEEGKSYGIWEMNGEGYRICGQKSKSGRKCKRIGNCPFHPKKPNWGKKSLPNRDFPITKKKYRLSWNTDEHFLFLKGLQQYGKGKWKLISNLIPNRNSTQVTSHAQKYFKRQEQKDKKNKSLHDITLGKVSTNSGKREIALRLSLPPDHIIYSFPFEKVKVEPNKKKKKKKKKKRNTSGKQIFTPNLVDGKPLSLLERLDSSVDRNPVSNEEKIGSDIDSYDKTKIFKKDLRPFPRQPMNINSNESTPRTNPTSFTPLTTPPVVGDSGFMLLDRDETVGKELQFDLDTDYSGTTSVLGKRERTTDPTTYLNNNYSLEKKRKTSSGDNNKL